MWLLIKRFSLLQCLDDTIMSFDFLWNYLLSSIVIIFHIFNNATHIATFCISSLYFTTLWILSEEISWLSDNLTIIGPVVLLVSQSSAMWQIFMTCCMCSLFMCDSLGWSEIQFVPTFCECSLLKLSHTRNFRILVWVSSSITSKVSKCIWNSSFCSMWQYTSFEMGRFSNDVSIFSTSWFCWFEIVCFTGSCWVCLWEQTKSLFVTVIERISKSSLSHCLLLFIRDFFNCSHFNRFQQFKINNNKIFKFSNYSTFQYRLNILYL